VGETAAADMSKVHVDDQGSDSPVPRFRKVRKLHGDSSHADPEGIDNGVCTSTRGQAKKQKSDRLFLQPQAERHCRGVCQAG
jgi:hypothetical protein